LLRGPGVCLGESSSAGLAFSIASSSSLSSGSAGDSGPGDSIGLSSSDSLAALAFFWRPVEKSFGVILNP